MVITIGNTKGGSGKSTTAWHLAVWLAQQRLDVLLIDADDDTSTAATMFTAHRESLTGKVGYAMLRLTQGALKREVPGLRNKYHHIIIDTGATDTKSLRAALVVTDWLVVPCQPRVPDLWVTLAMMSTVLTEVNDYRSDPLKVVSFISKADPRGQSNRETVEVLKAKGFNVLEEMAVNRKCFDSAFKAGLTIFELEEIDEAHSKAKKELNNLFKELIQYITHDQEVNSPSTSH